MVRDDMTNPVPNRGKLFGTCAALSDRTGIDDTLLRIVAIVLLFWAFMPTLVAYCAAAVAFHLDRR
ncbi:PspC domain-containing protein [Sphingomonas nostoxanthinifaciens]|uniref:PspC domain-containing protein n=1 Tax=Sphingomonas nostoxanthinifaciens TaxID=2872652 RepID=UPI001CC1DDE4|nr:PspC domain-containing protein [Sphingomonas nostoxanthinifaciens]UAK24109.1 PspC domain-containing protein [Sphingomonas nostoxanthinifaciens]